MQGGSFIQGAAGGLIGKYVGYQAYENNTGDWHVLQNTMIVAGSAYLSAKVTGGRPGTAMASAVMVYLFNEEAASRHINSKPGGENGPTITFKNDDPNGPSTDVVVDADLATMVEEVAVSTGYDININSTTGGHTSGPHVQGRAVDINRINGLRVDDPNNLYIKSLQEAFINHGNANQVLGPVYNVNIWNGSSTQIQNQRLINAHRDHLHINVPR